MLKSILRAQRKLRRGGFVGQVKGCWVLLNIALEMLLTSIANWPLGAATKFATAPLVAFFPCHSHAVEGMKPHSERLDKERGLCYFDDTS
jgi:hypothetical protein